MEATVAAPKLIPISPNTKIEEIHRIYQAQVRHKQALRSTTVSQRKEKLKKLMEAVFRYRTKVEEAVNKDLRKAAVETDYAEIYIVVSEIRYALSHIDEWMAPHEVETPLMYVGSSSYVLYEPKGNSLLMTPWNYPFSMPVQHLVSNIAAGNTAIIKPSEFTPNTSRVVKELLAEVFPEEEVAVIEGDHTISAELLRLRFDHIHFTGSPAVGKVIMRAASEFLTSVTLELGGKSPVIIDETANIPAAVKKLTWGKFLNVGQTCIAPDYILIHESKKDEFIQKFRERLIESFGEQPEQSPDMGRIVNNKHFNRVKKLIEDAVQQGAKIEVGGQMNEAENFIAPTILSNIPAGARIMEEEIFGPVLPVLTFKNLDEALNLVNGKEKPLALYIFSSSNKVQERVLRETSAGGTCINDNLVHISQANLPFGGVNNSGIGKSTGFYGFKEFSNERAVLKALHSGSVAMPLWYPYKGLVKNVVNIMLKWF